MDWARYLRAMDADYTARVEDKRLAFLRGDVRSMSDDDWKTIEEHEELLRRWPIM